ncbi:DUF4296 domain-containing protein [Flavobacterium sp. SM2513]|uniref:DUF4296 domain-containing protein n=1 Tax=Flavobacterium sp. SM2513 TaxID=3424766 RepID=UPI003D7FB57F
MKKMILILVLGVMLVNCNSKSVPKPDNLIGEDEMVDILYDLYVINAIRLNNSTYLKEQNSTPAKYIYQKYKIDSLQFIQSDHYYAADIDDYEKLHQRVTKRIERNKATIDSLIAKTPPEKRQPPRVDKVQETQFKLRDSLREKRLLREKTFSDSTRN